MAPSGRIGLGALLVLTLGVGLGSAPVWAQLTVEPQSISVAVKQHATETRTVTLTNTGSEALTFCVTFDRPLQRTGRTARLAEGAAGAGAPCGTYGEVLHRYDEEDLEGDTDFGGWGPYAITMTPEGRLFTAESGGADRTFELTLDLEYVGSFVHPTVAELVPFPGTPGVTYDPEGASGDGDSEGTLWWLNEERTGGSNSQTRRLLLLEGTFDGEPTGRQVEIAPPDEPLEDLNTDGLSYDAATDRFYFLGVSGSRGNPANWSSGPWTAMGTCPRATPSVLSLIRATSSSAPMPTVG